MTQGWSLPSSRISPRPSLPLTQAYTTYCRIYPHQPPPQVNSRSLPGRRADIGTTAGDGEDETLGTEDVDGAEHGVTADAVLLLELLH